MLLSLFLCWVHVRFIQPLLPYSQLAGSQSTESSWYKNLVGQSSMDERRLAVVYQQFTQPRTHGMHSTKLIGLQWNYHSLFSLSVAPSSHLYFSFLPLHCPVPRNQSLTFSKLRFTLKPIFEIEIFRPFRLPSFLTLLSSLHPIACDISRSGPVGNEITGIHIATDHTFHHIIQRDRRKKWLWAHVCVVCVCARVCAC